MGHTSEYAVENMFIDRLESRFEPVSFFPFGCG